ELVLDLLDHHRRAGGDDGNKREVLGVLGLRHGQRLDVIATAGEQADDAGKNARLVIDQNRQRMALGLLNSWCRRIMRRGWRLRVQQTITLPFSVTASPIFSAASPRIISLCARPYGIIGKQFSFGSTTQSNSTGLSTSIISLMA